MTVRRLHIDDLRVSPLPARALYKIDHHFRVLVDDKKMSRSGDTETPKSLELYKSQPIHCFLCLSLSLDKESMKSGNYFQSCFRRIKSFSDEVRQLHVEIRCDALERIFHLAAKLQPLFVLSLFFCAI